MYTAKVFIYSLLRAHVQLFCCCIDYNDYTSDTQILMLTTRPNVVVYKFYDVDICSQNVGYF